MSMTSRQRVSAAISQQAPDIVPVDLNVTVQAYQSLLEHLGLRMPDDYSVNGAMEIIPDAGVLARLGVDLISVKFPSTSTGMPESFTDSWGITRKKVGNYYEAVTHPLCDASIDDLQIYEWPKLPSQEKIRQLETEAEKIYNETELALVGRFGGPVLELAADLLGMEQWYMRLLTEKEFILRLLNIITDICTQYDLIAIEACGKYLQIMKVSGEDFGVQTGPLYSPDVFNGILLPILRKRWTAVRQKLKDVNSDAKIMLHSCGSISCFIQDLIDAGIDIIDPVQPLAEGMEPEKLKKKFSDRIVFHGGIDIQQLLPNGSPEEVYQGTVKCLEGFKAEKGGFILAPAHSVQADVPPENILAMIKAVKNWDGK
jgi:uroporphyrinogen decarboxylase